MGKSFFTEKRLRAMFGGGYICDECGATMEWENENEDSLVCLKCGFSIDPDRYGFDSDEEYEAMFPTEDDF